jgi:regulator of cell morphogenesis and NO signaling
MLRSPDTSTSAQATVTSCLASEHGAFDALMGRVSDLVTHGELLRARQAFAELARKAVRHIRFEEDVLFPVFEQATGMFFGPTTVVRREHGTILARLDALAAALEQADAGAFEKGRRELAALVAGHHRREQHALYPVLDFIFEPEERARILRTR